MNTNESTEAHIIICTYTEIHVDSSYNQSISMSAENLLTNIHAYIIAMTNGTQTQFGKWKQIYSVSVTLRKETPVVSSVAEKKLEEIFFCSESDFVLFPVWRIPLESIDRSCWLTQSTSNVITMRSMCKFTPKNMKSFVVFLVVYVAIDCVNHAVSVQLYTDGSNVALQMGLVENILVWNRSGQVYAKSQEHSQ